MNIAVLVSGGVDSSVALRLLQEQGHTVTAFYLKIWLEDELSFMGTCPWEEDLAYVRQVCEQAQVPLEVVSLQREYWDHVVTYTIAEIKQGRTPNPDVLCNSRIKFGFFYDHLMKHYAGHFDKIASGHYAQVKEHAGKVELFCAPDPIKDQTYFLSYLTQKQLQSIIFPIGHLTKEQVRDKAQYFDLPNKERKDSQGICFLGKISFRDFIAYHLGEKEGYFVEYETGSRIGTHKGFWFYTIGQRQGMGLAGGPWYVVAKDTDTNTVFISRTYYAPDKERRLFWISDCNWISGHKPTQHEVLVKMRHGRIFHEAQLTYQHDGSVAVALADRDQGIAPGQFAALYDGTLCLGSGVISRVY